MLSDYVREQLRWRESKATQFPDDRGNLQSVAALRSLAEYVEAIEDEGKDGERSQEVARFDPHVDQETGKLAGERATRELSRYGYGYSVTAGSHAELLDDLWVACMEDAYQAAGEYSADYTEALTDGEAAAAVFGIVLPSRQRRA
jgi:hypothetical protein